MMTLSSEEVKELRDSKYNATMLWMQETNPDLRILRVSPDFPIPAHRPGQYTTLGLGAWEPRAPNCQPEELEANQESQLIRRAYSISCSILDERGELFEPEQSDWLEFYVVLVRSTNREEAPALTPRLFMLQEGDRLFLGPKITGHYTTSTVKPGDTVIFLSTGTGEAPNNYMTWELLRKGHSGPIFSACCARFKQDLGYVSVHQELMKRYPNYKYEWLTTRDPGINKKVYIQDLVLSGKMETSIGKRLDPEDTHVFLCGNPSMIGVPFVNKETGERQYPSPQGVVEILEKRGFQIDQPGKKIQGNIHFEEYW